MSKYLSPKPSSEEIERMLDNGELQRDQNKADLAIADLARARNVILVQRIVWLHSPPPTGNRQWSNCWYSAMCAACKRGDLSMLKWFVEHPTGRTECEQARQEDLHNQPNELLDKAAKQGHIEVLQFLYEQGVKDENGWILVAVIDRGQANPVKWLFEHCTYPQRQFHNNMMDRAASCGNLEVLQLQNFNPSGVGKLTSNKRRRTEKTNKWWSRAQYAPEWAARDGHLEVVKWLYMNHSDLRSPSAMDVAAERDHVEIVQWLHANGEGCTTKAVDEAAR